MLIVKQGTLDIMFIGLVPTKARIIVFRFIIEYHIL